MKKEPSPLKLRLMTLLQKALDEHDAEARAELNAILLSDADARRVMATTLVNEQALINHLEMRASSPS